jgi:pimeloyl-ACP methyl ester carboxylesterase
VIALDNRGYGGSTKFYDPWRYEPDLMANDALELLDFLQINRASIIGYSMGSRIMTFMALSRPERVLRLVFGGMGENLVKGVGRWQPIAQALEAGNVDDVEDPVGRRFRLFADRTGSDRMALAACIRPSRQRISQQQVTSIPHPALVVVGSDDDIAGSGAALAHMLPDGRALDLPGKDHMKAVGDKDFKQGVVEFFAKRT